ncbi:MAG: ABC transporter permease [Rhodocyclaceae bacterium]|nr:ABC transporter permease [Rhodocyclaceae bacterium]
MSHIDVLTPDIRLALRLVIRSRIVLIVVIVGLILCGVAWLAGQFSPRQPATVALDVGLSFIRVALPILALLQIQDLVAREVDRRLVLTSLTYPHSRSEFVIARFGAVLLLAAVTCLFYSALLAGVVTWVASVYPQTTNVSLGAPFLITSALVWFDTAVVVAFGLVLATIATAPHLVFIGGMGFMVIARSASTIIQLLEADRDIVRGADWYHQGLQWVQWIVPDLASLDIQRQRSTTRWSS